jgi:hypothetical protein
MGCNMHYILEKKYNGRWVGVASDLQYNECAANTRNYKFFSKLAGVRSEEKFPLVQPNGIPEDISDLSKINFYEWGHLKHSYGYKTLAQFCDIYNSVQFDDDRKYSFTTMMWKLFRISVDPTDDDIDNYRVVFFFDN